jgi:hypothetical protein
MTRGAGSSAGTLAGSTREAPWAVANQSAPSGARNPGLLPRAAGSVARSPSQVSKSTGETRSLRPASTSSIWRFSTRKMRLIDAIQSEPRPSSSTSRR